MANNILFCTCFLQTGGLRPYLSLQKEVAADPVGQEFPFACKIKPVIFQAEFPVFQVDAGLLQDMIPGRGAEALRYRKKIAAPFGAQGSQDKLIAEIGYSESFRFTGDPAGFQCLDITDIMAYIPLPGFTVIGMRRRSDAQVLNSHPVGSVMA